MPTVLRWNECRFYYFSNETSEFAHAHVDRGDASAKLWLDKGAIAHNRGFPPRDLALVCDRLATEREAMLKASPFKRLGVGEHAAAPDYRLDGAGVVGDRLAIKLSDGRALSRPLAWFPRLAGAKPAELASWEACAAGLGLHWPALDEDLSVEGLLRGRA